VRVGDRHEALGAEELANPDLVGEGVARRLAALTNEHRLFLGRQPHADSLSTSAYSRRRRAPLTTGFLAV
jgi:hypothetical protein